MLITSAWTATPIRKAPPFAAPSSWFLGRAPHGCGTSVAFVVPRPGLGGRHFEARHRVPSEAVSWGGLCRGRLCRLFPLVSPRLLSGAHLSRGGAAPAGPLGGIRVLVGLLRGSHCGRRARPNPPSTDLPSGLRLSPARPHDPREGCVEMGEVVGPREAWEPGVAPRGSLVSWASQCPRTKAFRGFQGSRSLGSGCLGQGTPWLWSRVVAPRRRDTATPRL